MANGMRKLLKHMKEHRINVLEAENARLREAVERNILPKYEEFNPPAPAMKAFQVYAKTVQESRADNARYREALRVLGKLAEEVIEDNKNSTEGSVYQVCPEYIVKVATTALSGPEGKESEAGDDA